jgi:molybdopterin-guanine dinucleotide biosynthesis protein MobB
MPPGPASDIVRVFGLAGWSGSGKTTLLVRLVARLTVLGYAVSTVKHAHHAFDVDQPGKDSYRHRLAGAHEVMVASGNRWALMHELRGAPEPTLGDLTAHMTPVDLLLVEGFKREAHDKLEIWRKDHGQPLRAPDDPLVVAVATDDPAAVTPLVGVPVFDLDDVDAIARFIVDRCGLAAARQMRA